MKFTNRVLSQTITTPGLTGVSRYTTTTVAIPWSILHTISVRVPPGHQGTTGVCVTFNNLPILPWSNTPTWLTLNDETVAYSVEAEITGKLAVLSYNTDQVAHSFFMRFEYTPIASLAASIVAQQVVVV